jgi:hypothetical protein
MKASLVAYNGRELHKKSKLKIIKLWACQAARNSQQSNFGRLKF